MGTPHKLVHVWNLQQRYGGLLGGQQIRSWRTFKARCVSVWWEQVGEYLELQIWILVS